MATVTRWSARFDLVWKPSLTFGRRRNEYLEWLDAEVDPAGFTESDQSVGVAPRSPLERLIVGRSHAFLELRGPKADPGNLRRALEGALQCIEPSGARVDEYRAQWSVELDLSYDEARQRLVGRLFPPALKHSGATMRDGAYFMEGALPSGHVAFDYGIVSENELRERLEDPELTRIGGTPLLKVVGVDRLPLPRTAIYLDLTWTPEPRQGTADANEALIRLRNIEKQITMLITDLVGSVT